MRFTVSCAAAALLAALGFFATSAGAPQSAVAAAQVEQPALPPLSEQPAMMVGSGQCVLCHEQSHEDWISSRHSKMVQPARPGQVRGDFSQERLTLRGEEYRIRRLGSRYFITESFFTGAPVEHQVDYTLGNRRIQHYLTTLEDGRVIVLPPTWDVLRREWFHNLEIAAPDQREGIVPVQLWNKNCFGCHVSDQVKGFRPGENRYDTTWLDFGTTCERCHGPGSRHVDKYMNLDTYGDDPESHIVLQTRLDHQTNSMVCAQCHSFRDQMAFGFAAGDNYFDFFFPLLEYTQEPSEDPTWYPDGKTRRFSTNSLGIWQSECFVEGGATCTGCHLDPHRPDIERNEQLLPTNNGLCTGCHEAIGADLTAHTFHPAESEGSSCVECHMPRSVTSIRAKMRDHSISIPSPRNTARFGVPNACNECHAAESPEWATARMDEIEYTGRANSAALAPPEDRAAGRGVHRSARTQPGGTRSVARQISTDELLRRRRGSSTSGGSTSSTGIPLRPAGHSSKATTSTPNSPESASSWRSRACRSSVSRKPPSCCAVPAEDPFAQEAAPAPPTRTLKATSRARAPRRFPGLGHPRVVRAVGGGGM